MSQVLRKCVIAGGSGAVGQLFASLLTNSGREICIIDQIAPRLPLPFEIGDITRPHWSLQRSIQEADLVMLALPERVAQAALSPVLASMRQGSLLAHTLSVQSPLASALDSSHAAVEAVGLNPMFAPGLGIVGRPIATVILRDGPLTNELLQLVTSWGGRIVRVTAEEHDRLTTATQVLTHALILTFGLALANLEIDISQLNALAPPPHSTLLALLARIVSGTPEVYWDIQTAHPLAEAARSAFIAGLEQFLDAVENEKAFQALLQTGRGVLDGKLEHYQQLCARLFACQAG